MSETETHGTAPDWDVEQTHPEPKESRLMLVSLILASVALAAAAQIMLKHGMNQFFDRTGHAFRFDGASFRTVVRIPAVWIGLTLFGLSAIVFTIGVVGVLVRRNALIIFMSVELMLNAANLAFVAFAWNLKSIDGQIFVFFVMTVAAAEVAIGLAIIVHLFRLRETVFVDEISLLKG